jgi:uncharacterized protein YecE (DUF72 family)
MTIRIGTSGWVYPHWRGLFYPRTLPTKQWFDFYAHEFDTVEVNNSFYRLPTAETFAAWRTQAPPGFCYAIKASRFLTHLKKLLAPEEPLQNFFERAQHLGPTLGPVLYQLPPHWHVNLERFEYFLAALPRGYQHVVEFRDASWLIEDIFQLMERYQVAHCLHDMSPLHVPLRLTAPLVYIRFHGHPTYSGDYSDHTLQTWAERLTTWHSEHPDIFVYFNNDVGGYALKNARTLKRLVQAYEPVS